MDSSTKGFIISAAVRLIESLKEADEDFAKFVLNEVSYKRTDALRRYETDDKT